MRSGIDLNLDRLFPDDHVVMTMLQSIGVLAGVLNPIFHPISEHFNEYDPGALSPGLTIKIMIPEVIWSCPNVYL